MATANLEHRAYASKQDRLFLRISHRGTNRYVGLDVQIPERHWNTEKQAVRKSHPDVQALNRHLATVTEQAQKAINDIARSSVPITAGRVQDRFRELRGEGEPGETDFIRFARDFVDGYHRRGQQATFEAYRAVLNKFTEFVGGALRFEDLDPTLVREFETHLYAHHDNKPNTVAKNLSVLRTFCKAAIREGHIDQSDYPFFDITITTEEVKKERLSLDQIEQLRDLELAEGAPRWHARNYFVFAFYAGGMRFSDVATIEWTHLQGNRVAYKMRKTGEHVSMKLPEPGRAILAHYRGRQESHDRIFPILDGYDLGPNGALTGALKKEGGRIRRLLGKIGQQLGFKIKLSFHLARHSFADYLRRQGVPTHEIQNALGHSSLEQTEAYLAGFDQESLDETIDSVF